MGRMAPWLALLLLGCVEGAQVLQLVPGMSRSHILFNHRLAGLLADLGHDVTLLTLVNITDSVPGQLANLQSQKRRRAVGIWSMKWWMGSPEAALDSGHVGLVSQHSTSV